MREAAPVDELCSDIELNFAPGEPFQQAARYYVLRTIAKKIPDNELPAELRFIKQLGSRRCMQ